MWLFFVVVFFKFSKVTQALKQTGWLKSFCNHREVQIRGYCTEVKWTRTREKIINLVLTSAWGDGNRKLIRCILYIVWQDEVLPWQSFTAFSMSSAERMEVRDMLVLRSKKTETRHWGFFFFLPLINFYVLMRSTDIMTSSYAWLSRLIDYIVSRGAFWLHIAIAFHAQITRTYIRIFFLKWFY